MEHLHFRGLTSSSSQDTKWFFEGFFESISDLIWRALPVNRKFRYQLLNILHFSSFYIPPQIPNETSTMTDCPSRKRKRVYGTFACDYPDCDRAFSRADHLSRHKRNHDVSRNYRCTWPQCLMTFTRSDIKDKHYKRHLTKSNSENSILESALVDFDDLNQDANPSENVRFPNRQLPELNLNTQPNIESPNVLSTIDSQDYQDTDSFPRLGKTLSPSDLIEWLFHEENSIPYESDVLSHQNGSKGFDFLEVFQLKNHSSQRKLVSESLRDSFITLIPSLGSNIDFSIPKLERALEIYWLIYHPQYPILHRPSFATAESNPLLLLAMIMLGTSLSSCTGKSEDFENPNLMADEIAIPLRWLIFSHGECKPPAKAWVVQSLLLLETYEITSSSRFLHERAYLHHGSKVQLLRRSPVLGGDHSNDEVGKKWIEAESIKRATLMAFYLDTVHATVYGHMIILYAHQIKLSLPCEEELWENENEYPSKVTSPPKFLSTLKKLLHRRKVETGAFGKKILLAGLLTIMFQMQQKDLQLSFLEWNTMKESWKQTISLAIDVWRVDICTKDGCCDTLNSLKFPQEEVEKLPPSLRLDDKRCKFGLYHISQIYMRISHYDYIIYAGAPRRMNVKAGMSQYKGVEARINDWSNSINGGVSVIHAYLFLSEMLLSEDNDDISYSYDPNGDPFLHRRNIIASAVLVIFAYNFSLEGPEANIFDRIQGDYYPDKEDAHLYLRRIKKSLSKHGSFKNLTSSQFHDSTKLHASYLATIPGKNNIVGLLKFFYKAYRNCHWEIGREYSNLFKNCMERCLGRAKITCETMYDTKLL